jgi:hypothetical protein
MGARDFFALQRLGNSIFGFNRFPLSGFECAGVVGIL